MIKIRKSGARGHANHGWLDSHHTFSFADYFDASHMGFSVLRVINEDRIKGGTGFGTHGHRDMEIISYVIDGALEHEDSMGTKAVIHPGDVQRMSAGTGVRHSEQNHHKDQTAHFLQIWILPKATGLPPGYDQKSFAKDFNRGGLVLVGSESGRDGSVKINQDVDLYAAKAKEPGEAVIKIAESRRAWLQVIKGQVNIAGDSLQPGDGAAIEGVRSLNLTWAADSEFLVFDLP